MNFFFVYYVDPINIRAFFAVESDADDYVAANAGCQIKKAVIHEFTRIDEVVVDLD